MSPTPPDSAEARPNRRRHSLLAIGALCILGAAAYGGWWYTHARFFESTDDAYVAGNVVQITPQVGGTVIAIEADDTQQVQSGQPLLRLDPSDAQVALDQAEAQLGQTVRQVRALYASGNALEAVVAQRQADLAKARDDLARRQQVASTGAVAKEEIDHAKDAVRAAETALRTAQEQLATNRVQTNGVGIAEHPEVKRAAARVEEAYLALARTTIPAPIGGMVAKRSVQVGQRVAAGSPLMAVVPLEQLWVDANFKESQLSRMRVDQAVTLTADLYGSKVVYHGKVAGLGAGTGAAFALLPAQNATGNWIKVVQRLPVRVTLDTQELAAHPLRIGLSMQVEVDMRDAGHGPLTAAAAAPAASTNVYADTGKAAAARVAAIIAANDGSAHGRHPDTTARVSKPSPATGA